eukprot:scaffold421281_cov53-Attheya_sp.AAC.1
MAPVVAVSAVGVVLRKRMFHRSTMLAMMVMMTATTSGYSYSSCRTTASGNSMRLNKRVHFSAASPSARTVMMHMSSSSQQPWRYTTCCNPKEVSISSSALKMSSYGAADTDKTTNKKMIQAVISTVSLVLLDVLARALCKRLQISFPSSLAACGALLVGLLILPGGETLYSKLEPGSAVLAKWLPVFFVPSLVTVAKVGAVVVGGFFFTLLTTAWSVLGVRKLLSSSSSNETPKPIEEENAEEKDSTIAAATTKVAPAPFSVETSQALQILASSCGVGAILAFRSSQFALAASVSSVSMLFGTLAAFVFGVRLPASFRKVVHPLVTCTTLTWVWAQLLGKALALNFKDMLLGYKTGSLFSKTAGAGDLLLFLLGPAVVSLACQMYNRKQQIKENIAEVGTAVGVSSVGGLFGTAAAVRWLGISNPILRLCLLSRNITSPLAMAIASILGADVSLAVSMVVVTGLLGANFGASILSAFGIHDAVARGLGIGAAAHGLGTAAFANEPDAFPFAAIAMALTASACT